MNARKPTCFSSAPLQMQIILELKELTLSGNPTVGAESGVRNYVSQVHNDIMRGACESEEIGKTVKKHVVTLISGFPDRAVPGFDGAE